MTINIMGKNFKKLISLMVGVMLMVGVVGCGNTGDADDAVGDAEEDKVVINLGATPYLHAEVIASVFETAFEELGYETKRVEGDVGFMFLGLSQHDIDVYMDGWLPVLQKTYLEKYEDEIVIMDHFYEDAPIGVAVPTYMEDIDTVQDYIDNADLFDGKLVGIEPGSGMMQTTHAMVEAYDAEDTIEVIEGSTPAMLAEVDSSIRDEDPVAFLAWSPHIMFQIYDIKMIEDEKGVWDYGSAHPFASTEFEDKAPKAFEFANNFEIPIDDLEEILHESETTDATVDSATREWFEDNREALDAILEQGDDN